MSDNMDSDNREKININYEVKVSDIVEGFEIGKIEFA